jgi:hypothetical protein
MKESCIPHPPNDPLILIRRWQIDLCDGNVVAAALLSFFEYWHNIKLEQQRKAVQRNDVREKHGDERRHDESLWQWHTEADLLDGIMITSQNPLRRALHYLTTRGYITQSQNPNPRYHFDRTRYFVFHPEMVIADQSDLTSRGVQLDSPSVRLDSRSVRSDSPIPEIPSETSPEIPPPHHDVVVPGMPAVDHPPTVQPPEAVTYPPAARRGKKPIADDDWPGLRTLLEKFSFALPPLDDNNWWNILSYTCNCQNLMWLEREFARMEAWLDENPGKRPTTRWKTFVRGWLERSYERERKGYGT